MFTGIVQTKAKVESLTDKSDFRHLTVSVEPHHLDGVQLGASIAINGVCLTVVHFDETQVSFDVIDETLRLTNLGELKVGSEVNFERSLRVGDEMGGHYVSGHIHCTASRSLILKSVNIIGRLCCRYRKLKYLICSRRALLP